MGRVAGKVSYIGVFACKRMAIENHNHDKTSKRQLNNKSVVSESRQHLEHFEEFLFLSCKSTEWSSFLLTLQAVTLSFPSHYVLTILRSGYISTYLRTVILQLDFL